ncbi:cell surface glycoprotein (s-layer protein)-like protein [Anaeramoeba flamelloides]|uniref:Cell surface glycoprotein (S-layer protein)-like protein n=1 Tax=Anaeramoeba flamelloides TaxID=1746091 RepID=A0AAV7Y1D9_9EUKA|nr:cell surface glycoprotein (s-layer protein)-like protein [Anaeramoeba flamelloides]
MKSRLLCFGVLFFFLFQTLNCFSKVEEFPFHQQSQGNPNFNTQTKTRSIGSPKADLKPHSFFVQNTGFVSDEITFLGYTPLSRFSFLKDSIQIDLPNSHQINFSLGKQTNLQPKCSQKSSKSVFNRFKKDSQTMGQTSCSEVEMKSVLAGVDWLFTSSQDKIKSSFTIKRASLVSSIKIKIETQLQIEINKNGELEFRDPQTNDLLFLETSPVIFQDGKEYPAEFVLGTDNLLMFQMNDEDCNINKESPLTIDPTFVTYLGKDDYFSEAYQIASMGDSVLLLGRCFDLNYLYNSSIGSHEGINIFVTKLSGDGKNVEWSTIIGSNKTDQPKSFTFDSENNIVIVGSTIGIASFPTVKAIESECSEHVFSSGFILKLNSQGTNLEFSSLICPTDYSNLDVSTIIYNKEETDIDQYYIGGTTNGGSNNEVPTGGYDFLLSNIEYSNNNLKTNRFLLIGGTEDESVNPVLSDTDSDQMILLGSTISKDFPIVGSAYQKTNPSEGESTSCIVLAINKTNFQINWSTYLGGSKEDHCYSITNTQDLSSNIWVAGETRSPDFPLVGEFNDFNNFSQSGFFFNMKSDGSDLLYSSFLNNNLDQAINSALSIKINKTNNFFDANGLIYICGHGILGSNEMVSLNFTAENDWSWLIVFDTNSQQITATAAMSTDIPGGQPERGYLCSFDFEQDGTLLFAGTSSKIITTPSSLKSTTTARNAFAMKVQSCYYGSAGYNWQECERCMAGTFNPNVGAYHCTACPKGTMGTRSGSFSEDVCTPCQPGYYNSQYASTGCSACKSGQFSNQNSSTSCKNCQAGEFSDGAATSCQLCPKGYYSNEKANNCTYCEEDYYNNKEGASSCTKCGSFSNVNDKHTLCEKSSGKIALAVTIPLVVIIIIIVAIVLILIKKKKKINGYSKFTN